MGRRAKERKARRLAGRDLAAGRGSWLEDRDGMGGYVMAETGWLRRGAETAAYARQMKEAKAAAERAFQTAEKEERRADPDARAADELVAEMLKPAEGVDPLAHNSGE